MNYTRIASVPRPRRNRRAGSGAGVILGIIALAAVIILSVAAISYYKWIALHRVPLDPHTNCPVTGPVSATAVLLDVSVAISQATLEDLRNKFDRLVAGIPKGGLISIYGLTGHAGDLRHMFTGCNPGDGSDADPITSNPRLAKQRWEEDYQKPFDEFGKAIGTGKPTTRNPIMAAIQKIELTFFAAYPAKEKHLLIASDMIEYTDVYSQYTSGASYAAFRLSAAKDMYMTSLDEVNVSVFYIRRSYFHTNTVDHCEFWARWFMENRAASVEFVKLQGLY